jgi:hypothetical protein
MRYMPTKFRVQFGNVVSLIIDCFDIVLISRTPDGTIRFISTGHTSDNAIVPQSGFLN